MRPRVSAVHWEGLMLDLTVHRTAAVQAVLTDNTRVALVLVVQWMVEPIFGQLKYRTASRPLKVSATLNRHTPLSSRATEHATVAGSDRAGSSRGAWGERLPGQDLLTGCSRRTRRRCWNCWPSARPARSMTCTRARVWSVPRSLRWPRRWTWTWRTGGRPRPRRIATACPRPNSSRP